MSFKKDIKAIISECKDSNSINETKSNKWSETETNESTDIIEISGVNNEVKIYTYEKFIEIFDDYGWAGFAC